MVGMYEHVTVEGKWAGISKRWSLEGMGVRRLSRLEIDF